MMIAIQLLFKSEDSRMKIDYKKEKKHVNKNLQYMINLKFVPKQKYMINDLDSFSERYVNLLFRMS